MKISNKTIKVLTLCSISPNSGNQIYAHRNIKRHEHKALPCILFLSEKLKTS
jgi:hypothetical protein